MKQPLQPPPKSAFVPAFMPLLATVAAVLLASGCVSSSEADSVVDAKRANARRPVAVSEPAASFLVEMVDARLMNFEEGKLAVRRGTTPAIRDYGRLMMQDQSRLLAQLELLAVASRVTVPVSLSNGKLDGLNSLIKAEGADFDARFIRSIRNDHQHDVGALKDASAFPDVAIARFARDRLPMVQSHLDGIAAIENTY